MRSILVMFFLLLGVSSKGAETVGFGRTDTYPGFDSAPALDVWPTAEAIYLVGGNSLYTHHAQRQLRGIPHQTTFGSFRPYRIFPLGEEHLLLSGIGGTRLVDITTPLSPVVVGYESPSAVGAVAGQIGFINSAGGAELVNFVNRSAPEVVGQIPKRWVGAAAGNRAYAVSTENGVQFEIWNVSNPAAPTLVGSAPLSTPARRIYVSGARAFVLASTLGLGVEVFDLSEEAQPQSEGTITAGDVYDIALDGETVWLGSNLGLFRADLGDLPNVTPNLEQPLAGLPQALRILNGRLYVADEASSVVRAFDITGREVNLVDFVTAVVRMQSVTKDGSIILASGGQEIGSFRYEGAGPLIPLVRFEIPEPIFTHTQKGPRGYLNSGSNPGLAIVDFSSPVRAELLYGGVPAGTPSNWYWGGALVENNFLYVASSAGLTVLNVADAEAPQVAWHKDVTGLSRIILHEGYLYGAVRSAGVAVFKLLPSGEPDYLKTIPISGSEYVLAAEGDLLVVGVNHISGLSFAEMQFYDLSVPETPRFFGWGPSLQVLHSLDLENSILYATTSARLRAFDLAEVAPTPDGLPHSFTIPILAYHYDFDEGFMEMIFSGGKMIVTEGNALSLWSVQFARAELSAEIVDGNIHLEWISTFPGPYEVQSATDPAGPWAPVVVLSATEVDFAIPQGGAARFYRVQVLPR